MDNQFIQEDEDINTHLSISMFRQLRCLAGCISKVSNVHIVNDEVWSFYIADIPDSTVKLLEKNFDILRNETNLFKAPQVFPTATDINIASFNAASGKFEYHTDIDIAISYSFIINVYDMVFWMELLIRTIEDLYGENPREVASDYINTLIQRHLRIDEYKYLSDYEVEIHNLKARKNKYALMSVVLFVCALVPYFS